MNELADLVGAILTFVGFFTVMQWWSRHDYEKQQERLAEYEYERERERERVRAEQEAEGKARYAAYMAEQEAARIERESAELDAATAAMNARANVIAYEAENANVRPKRYKPPVDQTLLRDLPLDDIDWSKAEPWARDLFVKYRDEGRTAVSYMRAEAAEYKRRHGHPRPGRVVPGHIGRNRPPSLRLPRPGGDR
jgi:hypothetical protein